MSMRSGRGLRISCSRRIWCERQRNSQGRFPPRCWISGCLHYAPGALYETRQEMDGQWDGAVLEGRWRTSFAICGLCRRLRDRRIKPKSSTSNVQGVVQEYRLPACQSQTAAPATIEQQGQVRYMSCTDELRLTACENGEDS